jgi:hypothetical protein
MTSIIKNGHIFHGISVFGRGVFTRKIEYGGRMTYAGQHKDGYACGLGVLTYSNGSRQDGAKQYADYGPDGEYDGRYLGHFPAGYTVYGLYERGKMTDSAWVFANGSSLYNDVACAPDDSRLLALIAQVAPVEVLVRPAAPGPTRHRPPLASKQSARSAGSFCYRRSRRPWIPRFSPTQSAARRPWLPCGTTQWHLFCTTRPEGDA